MMRICTVSLLVCIAQVVYSQGTCISPTSVVFENKCFEVFETPSTWQEAEKNCSMFTARRTLAKVSSEAELSFLFSLKPNVSEGMWIGGSNTTNEGKWMWTDGTTANLSSLWGPHEPNNEKGNEYCLEIYFKEGMLNDESCDGLRPFVCMEMIG
ncbi:C-type lectin BML-2-like [Physella acuta]|uniref:C-type lectin BML-2-like n=1 Tax=Physella acuta TaxID=109671 RepID=UPI0027DBF80F|nr:C-type lectin BML-2-like [Physella acuta]